MVAYTNFYETVKEANMRLKGTLILYDGEPYYVYGIANHKGDGIFRVYMQATKDMPLESYNSNVPVNSIPADHPSFGIEMDKYLDAKKDTLIHRKMMNSPLFKKFRPFPLGMVNMNSGIIYAEVSPTRKTEQGLTDSKIRCFLPSLGGKNGKLTGLVSILSPELRDCIIGKYPTFSEAVALLSDKEVQNESIAFDRHFAIFKGPVGMFFLAYKSDVVGYVEGNRLTLANTFEYTKEAAQDLGIFSTITVRK